MLMNAALNANMITAMHAELNALCGSGSVVQARDGTVPTSIGGGDTGSLIAEIALTNPAFLTVSGGSAGLNGSTDDTNTGAGTVTYWRLKQSGGTTIFQWVEGDDMVTDDPAFASGDTCHLVDITIAYIVTPPDA